MMMKLTIKMMSGHEKPLEVSGDGSVGELKQCISDLFRVTTNNQKLCVDNDKSNILEDDARSLSSYGLKSGSVVNLLIRNSFQVFVKNEKGQIKTYDVDVNETVDQLKAKIHHKERVPVDQQKLIFSGKQLESGMKLLDYGITSGCTIYMTFYLRGG